MTQLSRVQQKFFSASNLAGNSRGFILLEVLLAMGLVATSWMALSVTYQQLILRQGQLNERRVQLRQEIDRHEIALLGKTPSNHLSPNLEKAVNESIGMSRRSGTFSRSGSSPGKK